MKTFQFTRPRDNAEAISAGAKSKTAQQGAEIRFIAGGTTLIDLMKLNVETPQSLVDVNRLPLDKIEATPDGGLTIGAVVRNSDLAWHPLVRKNYRGSFRSDPERRDCADSKHGHDCRQSVAADALHVLPGHGDAV